MKSCKESSTHYACSCFIERNALLEKVLAVAQKYTQANFKEHNEWILQDLMKAISACDAGRKT